MEDVLWNKDSIDFKLAGTAELTKQIAIVYLLISKYDAVIFSDCHGHYSRDAPAGPVPWPVPRRVTPTI
jgi:hypothetical protein